MKAHYTRFETEEQFNQLAEKAGKLCNVRNYWDGDITFGYDEYINKFISYQSKNSSEYYQKATYLPYTEYLEYLDKCIENAKK